MNSKRRSTTDQLILHSLGNDTDAAAAFFQAKEVGVSGMTPSLFLRIKEVCK
ncbi:MAG: hypothetical protein M0Q47_13840 [Methanothrix sp.]|jgi:hypothetical protein|uniref:hypothetical protein n=1 Tax=Methanothrix sp. TaxID=90426 RepID=UPI0025F0CEF5|nr:hypothetical protein [Methanothrix sp.]MCK9407475.1 hypothetical protein [Methanothrix sp.]